MKDAFVQTSLTDTLNIKLGHYKEFYGIDNLTSDNYVSFMERSVSSVYWPEEAMGAGAMYSDGKLFGLQAGLFSPGVANGGAGGPTYWSVPGRASVAPKGGDRKSTRLNSRH